MPSAKASHLTWRLVRSYLNLVSQNLGRGDNLAQPPLCSEARSGTSPSCHSPSKFRSCPLLSVALELMHLRPSLILALEDAGYLLVGFDELFGQRVHLGFQPVSALSFSPELLEKLVHHEQLP